MPLTKKRKSTRKTLHTKPQSITPKTLEMKHKMFKLTVVLTLFVVIMAFFVYIGEHVAINISSMNLRDSESFSQITVNEINPAITGAMVSIDHNELQNISMDE